MASAWIGKPLGLMSIETTAACEEPDTRRTPVTAPTSTPAIRTGELIANWVSVVNTALSTNGEPENGSVPPNTA